MEAPKPLPNMRALLHGGSQWPLRVAIGRIVPATLRDRGSLLIGAAYALGFGTMNTFVMRGSMPAVFAFGSAFLFSAYITLLAPVPWHWRLLRRPGPVGVLLANGAVATVLGSVAFFCSLMLAATLAMGPDAALLRVNGFLRFSGWGIIAGITGFPMALGNVADRAARRERRHRASLERLAEQARIVALRAQVNPHFFFNALNTIAALIPTRPADAERAVELLAESLRPVLMRDQPMVHPLRTEFAVAEAYAQIERLRFGDRLRVEFDLPADLAALPVPSLSLQPLLENAVRHGAARNAGTHAVTVRAREEAGVLLVEVTDHPADAPAPAPGTDAPHARGHALHNIASRLAALFGREARLTVRVSDGGALSTMAIPIAAAAEARAAAAGTAAAPSAEAVVRAGWT